MTSVIQTRNLDFNFGGFKALNNLCLEVPENSIYGFVGPNGAGKSTAIRTILGLYPVREEKIFVFGKDISKERIEILSGIGASVESPSLYDHLSARDNLEITRRMIRCDKKRIGEVLETVGLSEAGDKKVKSFSLGMKQRLAIANALISEPALLILDEPANGLDPHGIKEMREFLLTLNREFGTTIFLSSHILSEVEKLVTHIGVINKGNLVFQGKLSELYPLSINRMTIETDNADRLVETLSASGIAAEKQNDFTVKAAVKSKEEISGMLLNILQKGVPVYSIENGQKTLEELFFDLTKN